MNTKSPGGLLCRGPKKDLRLEAISKAQPELKGAKMSFLIHAQVDRAIC
jgi:hypothetical protein